MRKSLLILSLTIISAHLFAQRGIEISKAFAANKAIILNDKPAKYADLKKAELISVTLLIQPQEVGSIIMDTTIIAVTKVFAIQHYKRLLSTYSKDYQSYIQHQPDDKNLAYFFNDDGSILFGGTAELIKRLSDIKDSDIEKVDFEKEKDHVEGKKPAMVFIIKKR